MVRDPDVASRLSSVALAAGKELDEVLMFSAERVSPEEFQQLRHAVGNVLGELLLSILNPLYRQHPELKPAELN
ncbi:hypothetical protein [Tahibacter harae]|uniref:Uncharacterized protein n=1 Tax=Tahibacter harae TaxID=2963937 RepID=A0ABT1QVP3_9GAMM|nr:hypothetical protein [Tahibacter harae]MCQ4166354.1 hypothetical protein [Tahibacter harae]